VVSSVSSRPYPRGASQVSRPSMMGPRISGTQYLGIGRQAPRAPQQRTPRRAAMQAMLITRLHAVSEAHLRVRLRPPSRRRAHSTSTLPVGRASSISDLRPSGWPLPAHCAKVRRPIGPGKPPNVAGELKMFKWSGQNHPNTGQKTCHNVTGVGSQGALRWFWDTAQNQWPLTGQTGPRWLDGRRSQPAVWRSAARHV
jgi:hypothetical protein